MSETATAALLGDNGGGQAAAAPAGAPAAPASNAPASWDSGFDEDTRAYVSAKGWKAPTDLLTSYRNLEKFAGGSKSLLELPGVDADPKAWEQVYNKLGRPESPDKYGIQPPEGADPQVVDWFKKTSHELGLTDKQAREMFNRYNELAGSQMQQTQAQMQQAMEQDIATLKREWGQGFDAQIDMGKRAVQALGLNEQKLSEYESKLGTGEMLRLFATLGSKMGEDSFVGGDRSNDSGFGLTPAAARQQLTDLKTDQRFMDAYMKGDKDAVAKMQRVMQAAYG